MSERTAGASSNSILCPTEELAQLYFDRWNVETNLRHLKQTLHMDVLRSKSEAGILKEVQMLALVYNLVRLIMMESAKQQDVDVDRISFVDALRWLLQRAAAGSTS